MEWKIPLALILLCVVFWSGWELKKAGRELDKRFEGILFHRLNHFYNLSEKGRRSSPLTSYPCGIAISPATTNSVAQQAKKIKRKQPGSLGGIE